MGILTAIAGGVALGKSFNLFVPQCFPWLKNRDGNITSVIAVKILNINTWKELRPRPIIAVW